MTARNGFECDLCLRREWHDHAETYACALAYGHAGKCSPNPDMGLCARQAYALEGGCGKPIPRVTIRADK